MTRPHIRTGPYQDHRRMVRDGQLRRVRIGQMVACPAPGCGRLFRRHESAYSTPRLGCSATCDQAIRQAKEKAKGT